MVHTHSNIAGTFECAHALGKHMHRKNRLPCLLDPARTRFLLCSLTNFVCCKKRSLEKYLDARIFHGAGYRSQGGAGDLGVKTERWPGALKSPLKIDTLKIQSMDWSRCRAGIWNLGHSACNMVGLALRTRHIPFSRSRLGQAQHGCLIAQVSINSSA